MAIEKEIIQSEIRATGAKQVQDDLLRVNQAMKDLTQEEKNLLFIKNKLEAQGKKNTEEYKRNADALKINKDAAAKNREELTKLNSQMKVADMTYNQLSKRAAELRSHLNNISKSADPEKWKHYNLQLKETTDQMGQVRAGGQQVGSSLGTLSKAVGFLGVGFFSVSTAMKAGKAIMEATQFTADKFAREIAGAKQAVDNFFIAISSGDWSNFWSGLKKSQKDAKELADTMDVLGDIRRGLAIQEVELENRKNEILVDLRDKTGRVTKEEKKKLYAELVKLDTEYNSKVLDAANRERDGILKLYSDITGLREDRIYTLIKNYGDYEQRFNASAAMLEKAKKDFNTDPYGTSKSMSASKFSLEDYLNSLNEVDRMYMKLYLAYGKLNDSKLDRLTGSIVAVGKALGMNYNTELELKRVSNEIFKQEGDNADNTVKVTRKSTGEVLQYRKALSAKIKTITQSDAEFEEHMQNHLVKTKKEADQAKLDLEKDFQAKKEAFVEAYAPMSADELKKKELNQLDETFAEIIDHEGLSNQERLDLTEEYEQAKANIELKYRIEKLDKIKEELATTNAMFQQANEFVTSLQDAALDNIEASYNRKIELAGNDKDEVSRLEAEKERQIKATKKKYADSAFAIQVAQIIATTAQAAINAYESLSSIPYVGPALGVIAAAAAGALGAAQIKKAQAERNIVKSLWTGGYTGEGDKYAPRGIVHAGEYVVSQDELNQPQVRNIVSSVIEPMRMKRLGYSSYAQNTTMPGFAGGGWTDENLSDIASRSDLTLALSSRGLTIGIIRTLDRMNKELNNLQKNGVNANFDQNKIYEMRQSIAKQEAMDRRARGGS